MGNASSELDKCDSLPNLWYCPDETLDASGRETRGASGRELEVNKYMSKRLEKLILTCEICYQMFDLRDQAPKSLSCQHTFCLSCLKVIHQHSTDRKLTCPKCRQIFTWEGDLESVPNDHKIVKLIDFLSENAKGNKNVCLLHGLQPLKFFCTTCDAPACKQCTTSSHDKTTNHNITDINRVMVHRKRTATEILTKAKAILPKLEQRKSSLHDKMSNLIAMKEISDEEIDEIFEKLRLDLESRRGQLKEMLHDKCSSKKAMISERRRQVSDIRDIYHRHMTELAAAMESQDFTRICFLLKTCQQLHEAVEPMANHDDDDVEPHIAFNIPVNLSVVENLKNIGEVEDRVLTEEEIDEVMVARSKIENANEVFKRFARLE